MGATDRRGRRAELMPAGHGTLAPPAQPSCIPPAVLLCPLHPLSLAQSLDALPDIQKTDVRSPEVFPGVTIAGFPSASKLGTEFVVWVCAANKPLKSSAGLQNKILSANAHQLLANHPTPLVLGTEWPK